jgi:serine protease Do
MKKIIIMIFIILLVMISVHVKAKEHTASEIEKFEAEIKGILHTVSPSILKVVTENHRRNFATGIAIDPNHVVSNIKVVQRPYKYVYIETVKGRKYTAKLVGTDRNSSLILLKINEKALIPIKYAKDYEVGDWIALVGAFFKEFPSIYQGILSSSSDEQVILNAPVVPGSPGGAVVNKKGELIGVIRGRVGFAFSPDYTFRDHSGEIRIEIPKSQHKDLCAAVPAGKVVDISRDIKKYGEVKRGWLGVTLIYDKNQVKIARVIKNSPAEKASLRIGDIITKINGKIVKTSGEVIKLVRTLRPEQKIKMELIRENKPQSVFIAVDEYRTRPHKVPRTYSWNTYDLDGTFPEYRDSLPKLQNYVYRLGDSRTLGVDVTALTPELAKELNIKEGAGLMVAKVYKKTAAEKAGFRPADIIVKVDDQPVRNNFDLKKVLEDLENNESVVVELYRKGEIKKIKVVPDKDAGFGLIFNRFRNKMHDIIHIEEEEKKQIEVQTQRKRKELQLLQEEYLKDIEMVKRKEFEKYKIQMEKVFKEQEKMREEMKKLKKELEKEKNKQKTATSI